MRKFVETLLILFTLNTTTEAADKIRIGVPVLGAQFITLPLAEKRGFLKEEGLEAEIIRIFGPAVSAALVSRELDYHMALSVQSAIVGLPIRVVACYVPATFIVLMAQPRFKAVKDLKGGTIAVNTFTGPPIFIARMIAKQFGLDPDRDLKFLASGLLKHDLPRLARDSPLRPCCLCRGIPGRPRWASSALPERTNYLRTLTSV